MKDGSVAEGTNRGGKGRTRTPDMGPSDQASRFQTTNVPEKSQHDCTPSTSTPSCDESSIAALYPSDIRFGANEAEPSEFEQNRTLHPSEQRTQELRIQVHRKMSEIRKNSRLNEKGNLPKSPRTMRLSSALHPLRHMVHFLVLLAGWALGTAVFYAIEKPAEIQSTSETFSQLHDAFDGIARDVLKAAKNESETEMADRIKKAYVKFLEIEGKWRWSAIQKTEGPEAHYMWTISSSLFFTWNLFTTVGYGSIYPGTNLGRLAVIIYSSIFYPFALVVIRDLGQQLLIALTIIYARLLIKIREARGYLTTEWETISLPWKMTVVIAFGYMGALAGVIMFYDDAVGPEKGMSYFISFYFTFISLTAIGLGDIMPTNEPWAPFIGILIVVSLPMMRVITKMTYSRIERAYFGAFLYLEGRYCVSDEVIDSKSVKNGDEENCVNEDEEAMEKRARELMMHNFTVRSLATYISSGGDVYEGEFGRVNVRKGDL